MGKKGIGKGVFYLGFVLTLPSLRATTILSHARPSSRAVRFAGGGSPMEAISDSDVSASGDGGVNQIANMVAKAKFALRSAKSSMVNVHDASTPVCAPSRCLPATLSSLRLHRGCAQVSFVADYRVPHASGGGKSLPHLKLLTRRLDNPPPQKSGDASGDSSLFSRAASAISRQGSGGEPNFNFSFTRTMSQDLGGRGTRFAPFPPCIRICTHPSAPCLHGFGLCVWTRAVSFDLHTS